MPLNKTRGVAPGSSRRGSGGFLGDASFSLLRRAEELDAPWVKETNINLYNSVQKLTTDLLLLLLLFNTINIEGCSKKECNKTGLLWPN